MVLFGLGYWTERHPVWPLLQSLSKGRAYADLITITDDEEEAVARIVAGHDASPSRQRAGSPASS
jgi:uncharacterized protein YpuA (DUF1002 family)